MWDVGELLRKLLTLMSNLIIYQIYRKKFIVKEHLQRLFNKSFMGYIAYSKLISILTFADGFFFSARNSAIFVTCNKH